MNDPDIPLVHVHVDNTHDFPNVVRTEETEPEHFDCTTFALQNAAGGSVNVGGAGSRPDIAQILALDLERKSAIIIVGAAPIVLCTTFQQAQRATNQGATITNPDGGYLPANESITIPGTGPLWAVNTTPATLVLVTVISNRRGS